VNAGISPNPKEDWKTLGLIGPKLEGNGKLWAEYGVQPTALLRVVGIVVAGARFDPYVEVRLG
jgi:hypothetical protein